MASWPGLADGHRARDYLAINRANWDSRAPIHAQNYGIERLLSDPSRLSQVVEFDRPGLGDLSGLDVVHLQCHIGTDTLSLHRLGGRVTGVDLSPASLAEARKLAAGRGADRLRRVRCLLRTGGARRPEVRSRVHRHRRDRLAAGHPALGGGRLCIAAARRAPVHPGGPPGALGRDRGPDQRRPGGPGSAANDHRRWSGHRRPGTAVLRTGRWRWPGRGSPPDAGDDRVGSPDTLEWNHGLGEIITALFDAGRN